MADIYRGSTPTLVFTPDGSVTGTPSVRISQGDIFMTPDVTYSDGKVSCTLTKSQTSQFNTDQTVIAQLVFTPTVGEAIYFDRHELIVGENYFDFQETETIEGDDPPDFEPIELPDDANPVTVGAYEYDETNDEYVLTSDITVSGDKVYYYPIEYVILNGVPDDYEVELNYVEITDIGQYDCPSGDGWKEYINGEYVASTDDTPVNGKTYYILDQEDDYEDEYSLLDGEFDGDAYCEDNDIETNWEEDLDETDYTYWDESDDFSDSDEADNMTFIYMAVTPVGTENPVNQAWLEYDSVTGEYDFTDDTVVDSGKTYFDLIIEDNSGDEENTETTESSG